MRMIFKFLKFLGYIFFVFIVFYAIEKTFNELLKAPILAFILMLWYAVLIISAKTYDKKEINNIILYRRTRFISWFQKSYANQELKFVFFSSAVCSSIVTILILIFAKPEGWVKILNPEGIFGLILFPFTFIVVFILAPFILGGITNTIPNITCFYLLNKIFERTQAKRLSLKKIIFSILFLFSIVCVALFLGQSFYYLFGRPDNLNTFEYYSKVFDFDGYGGPIGIVFFNSLFTALFLLLHYFQIFAAYGIKYANIVYSKQKKILKYYNNEKISVILLHGTVILLLCGICSKILNDNKIIDNNELDWYRAISLDSPQLYKYFIETYPDEIHLCKFALDRIEGLAWAQCLYTDNINSYHQYMLNYPSGRFVNFAKEQIKRITRNTNGRSLKNIELIFEYCGKRTELVPYIEIMKRFFSYSDVNIIQKKLKGIEYSSEFHYEKLDSAIDARIVLRVEENPLAASYEDSFRRSYHLYTGASIKGKYFFEIFNGPRYIYSFSGHKDVSSGFTIHGKAKPSNTAYYYAPFDKVFKFKGSFLPQTFKILKNLYGVTFLTGVTKDTLIDFEIYQNKDYLYKKYSNSIYYLKNTEIDNEDLYENWDRFSLRKELLEMTKDSFLEYGIASTDVLLTLLKNENPKISDFALKCLMDLRDPHTVQPLLYILDTDTKRSSSILNLLIKIGDPYAIIHLQKIYRRLKPYNKNSPLWNAIGTAIATLGNSKFDEMSHKKKKEYLSDIYYGKVSFILTNEDVTN